MDVHQWHCNSAIHLTAEDKKFNEALPDIRTRDATTGVVGSQEKFQRISFVCYFREKIAAWTHDYNTARPHSALGYATPAAFAADLKKQGAASLRIAGGYATQPLASPALTRNNDAEALVATG
jgi:hypothetical protein